MTDFWNDVPSGPFANEADVEIRVILPLLHALGYEDYSPTLDRILRAAWRIENGNCTVAMGSIGAVPIDVHDTLSSCDAGCDDSRQFEHAHAQVFWLLGEPWRRSQNGLRGGSPLLPQPLH